MSDIIVSGQPMWFIAYDVESENGEKLKPDEKDWLRSMRVEIWYDLRFKFKCAPIQNSLWLIRKPEIKVELEKKVPEWLEEYKKHDFNALIQIFPIATTEEGIKTFKQWEFEFILQWLGKIDKTLQKMEDSGKIIKKNLQANLSKIQLLGSLLREDFDDTFPNWSLGQDLLSTDVDRVNQLLPMATDVKRKVKDNIEA